MKNITSSFILTEEQENTIAFMNTIFAYFAARPELGKVKRVSKIKPWGHGERYYVRCTYRREYVVYEKDEKIHNIGVYKEDFI